MNKTALKKEKRAPPVEHRAAVVRFILTLSVQVCLGNAERLNSCLPGQKHNTVLIISWEMYLLQVMTDTFRRNIRKHSLPEELVETVSLRI